MKISIVIPAYNAAKYLAEAIESILAQSFANWELVIVDDGSADGTAEIAGAYAALDPRLHFIRQANRGVAEARNRGLSEASRDSECAIFLDADDVWEPNALEMLLAALHRHPDAVAASGLSRMIDDRSQPCEPGEVETWGRHRWGVAGKRLTAWGVHQPTTLAVLSYGNCIGTPGQALLRRAALEAAGPFDRATSPCEDWDMWLRLSQRGDIAFVDRVLLSWRKHEGNASRQTELMARQGLYVRQKLLASPQLSAAQRRTVLTANWFWGGSVRSGRLRWARQCIRQGQFRAAARQFRHVLASYVQSVRGLPAS